jgi:hypothetical protein
MNAEQTSQEKRSIKVKDFLDDFRTGASDEELIAKYHLTPSGLQKFLDLLTERGILDPKEIDKRLSAEPKAEEPDPLPNSEEARFICPSCLSVHQDMFDVCPTCGISFHQLISGGMPAPEPAEEQASDESFASARSELWEKESSEVFASVAVDKAQDGSELAVEKDVPPAAEFPKEDELLSGPPVAGLAEGFDQSLGAAAAERGPFDDHLDSAEDRYAHVEVLCQACGEEMQPALRDIYDRNRSLQALRGAAVSLFLGFLGTLALSFFDGYSLARVFVVYLTGVCLLSGTVLGLVGSFLYLAREKVYFCEHCRRVFPRG